MKGVVVVALVAAVLLANIGFVMATPPLPVPRQYEQFCDNQKVSGTGAIDVSTSINDKKLALEYYNVMAGDGDLEMDQSHSYSQTPINQGNVLNDSKDTSLNLLEKGKLTYNARKAPLTGGKFLQSDWFYGGIGADVQEMFSVNQMEKDQTTFFSSTANKSPLQNFYDPSKQYPETIAGNAQAIKDVFDQNRAEGGDGYSAVGDLLGTDPVHLIGIATKNQFNGTWGLDAKQHVIYYKDIKLHEMFTGNFETEKLVKFHESPVPDMVESPCKDIDC